MKRVLLLCLSLCALMGTLGGCAVSELENIQPPSTTVQPEMTAKLCPATDVFSFIVLGQTTPMEVLEKVPYEPQVIATGRRYTSIDYQLPDGTEVSVYFDSNKKVVVDVAFFITDDSRNTGDGLREPLLKSNKRHSSVPSLPFSLPTPLSA